MHLDLSVMELCIYGYIPVMVSAGCIKKSYNKCDKISGNNYIKDRLGNKFICVNQCKYCYNILYNSTPLYLQDLKAELLSLKPKALRYNFVNEAPSQVKDILSGNTIKNYTRGHYKRGVE